MTHGRYVKIVAADSPYLFVDEIEIYRGRNEMLSAAYQGSAVADLAGYVATTQVGTLGMRRIVTDAQNRPVAGRRGRRNWLRTRRRNSLRN